MSDETKDVTPALSPPSPPVASALKSGAIAVIALVISVAALGVSVYGLASHVMDENKLPPLPVVMPDTAGLDDRLQKQEERQGRFAEDIAKISAHLDALSKTPGTAVTAAAPGEEIKGSVEDLKQKMTGVEKTSAALQEEMRATLLRKTRLLSDWALLQSIRQKLRDGLNFSSERKALGSNIAPEDAHNLDQAANPQPLSDKSLRDDLHQLSPQFSSLEKMGQATGFFQKLAVRAESLVTIRPKDGLPVNDTASGKSLATLQDAVNAHAWPVALSASDQLAQKAPPDFAAWAARLKQRADAEAALDKMEALILSSLRDEPTKTEAAPAANEASP